MNKFTSHRSSRSRSCTQTCLYLLGAGSCVGSLLSLLHPLAPPGQDLRASNSSSVGGFSLFLRGSYLSKPSLLSTYCTDLGGPHEETEPDQINRMCTVQRPLAPPHCHCYLSTWHWSRCLLNSISCNLHSSSQKWVSPINIAISLMRKLKHREVNHH